MRLKKMNKGNIYIIKIEKYKKNKEERRKDRNNKDI